MLLVLHGCGPGDPPALQVGPLSWSADELLGVSSDARFQLAGLAALGLATSGAEVALVGAPRLEREIRLARISVLAAEEALERADVDDGALEAHYLMNPAYELEVRHLVLLSDEADGAERRETARRRAEEALDRIRAGESFPTVAAEVSEEPGAREREGLLQPGREGSWVAPFWSAAMALAEGEVSGVVETEYGFHVLRLERRDIIPFEEARPGVVREAARLLLGGDPTAPALEAAGEGAVVDLDLLEAWLEGESVTGNLVLWNGGGAPVDGLRRDAFTLPWSRFRPLLDRSVEGWAEVLVELGAEHRLDRRARLRGLDPEPGVIQALEREVERDVTALAAAFGFQAGMDREEVKSAALRGLRGSGQGLRIARASLPEHLPLLLSAYPVRVAGERPIP